MQRLYRVFGLLSACAVGFTASAADGTWVYRAGVGTSVTNFANWSDAANWEGGTIPSSLDDTAKLSAATDQYIRLEGGGGAQVIERRCGSPGCAGRR